MGQWHRDSNIYRENEKAGLPRTPLESKIGGCGIEKSQRVSNSTQYFMKLHVCTRMSSHHNKITFRIRSRPDRTGFRLDVTSNERDPK